MREGKISVIIPVYKVEEYLPRCLDSVLGQTHTDLEIILIDDGSPDNSGKLCDQYAAKDDRIKVIHKENGGVSSARNAGLDAATGDYIGFVDSDDWIEPDMYAFLLENAVAYDADISMCAAYFYHEGKQLPIECSANTYCIDRVEAKKRTVLGGMFIWDKLYKAELIKDVRYDTTYDCSEDLLFVYQALNKLNKAVISDIPKYHYEKKFGGLTSRPPCESSFNIVYIMKRILESEKGSPIYPYCIKGYTDAAYTVLSGVITSGFGADRYDELRNGLISFRKQILFGGHHSKKDKVKILLLSFSKKLYNAVIRKKHTL